MPQEISQIQDPALFTLTVILRFFDSTVDTQRISEDCGTAPIGAPEMVRVANGLGFKARATTTNWLAFPRLRYPTQRKRACVSTGRSGNRRDAPFAGKAP